MKKITNPSLIIGITLLSMLVGISSFAKEEPDKNKRKLNVPLYKSTGDPRYQILNINNLWTWMRADGYSNHSPTGDNGTYYPRGKAWVVYMDGIMWGGKCYTDEAMTMPAPFGQLIRVGGSNYDTGTQEGHIIGFGTNAVPADPASARIYRIRRDYASMDPEELRRDAAEYNETSIDQVSQAEIDEIYAWYEQDWNEWPVDLGAPFIDRNGNGIYDPPPAFNNNFTVDSLIAGGYDEPGLAGADPDFPADQVVWTVYNDLNRMFTLALQGSEPMGIEVQVTIWGYKSTDNPWGDLFFRRVRIINKGGVDIDEMGTKGAFWIDSMYVAQWSDPDLGTAGDDLVGCDTTLSMGFVYNGNAIDSEYRKFNLPPPAAGYDFMQGPIIPSPGDSAIFDLKRRYGYKNLGMTSFSWFSSGSQISDPPRDYNGTLRWYKMLRGYAPLAGPEQFYPFPLGIEPGPFPLSGDPVKGTGLLDGLGEVYSFSPGDRRMNCSTGPFIFAPGDTQEIVISFVCGMGTDRLSSISVMKYNDRFAQETYDRLFTPWSTIGSQPDVQISGLDQKVALTWGDAAESYYYRDGYTFQGYNIYQLPSRSSAIADIKRIATFDIIDNVTIIWDYIFDTNYGAVIYVPVQFGNDSGIQHFLQISEDHFSDEPLKNLKKYYFAVTSYVYKPDGVPKTLESRMQVLEVMPVGPVIGRDYSESVADSSATHVVGISSGKVIVTVVDPTRVTGHDYRVAFKDIGQLVWSLTDLTTNKVKLYEMPQLTSLNDLSAPVVDGLMIHVLGDLKGFESFQMVANAAGPLDPPEAAALFWQGFPVPTEVDPQGNITNNQQVGAGRWAFHTGDDAAGTRSSYESFLQNSCREDNFERLIPFDWEMRFTARGSYSYKDYEAAEVVWVPFELWCIGSNTPDDITDDYRLIPLLYEGAGGVVNNQYDLSQADHSASTGNNDPYTDWVYWRQPADMSPGEAGYDAYVASLDLSAMKLGPNSLAFIGDEVLARTVLINWNGGSAPPYNQDLPEQGSIIRLLTAKPNTVDDIFEFSTTEAPFFDITKGDVNDDDSVNVVDVVAVINFILQITQPTGEQEYAADFNNDLRVNIADVVRIINQILGIPKPLAKATVTMHVPMELPARVFIKENIITLPLEIASDKPIAGIQLEFSYDPHFLKPLSPCFKSDAWKNISIVQNSAEKGKVIYLFYSLENEILPISDLPQLKFEIIGDKNISNSAITLSGAIVADPRGNPMEIKLGNKVVSLSILPVKYTLYQNFPNPFNPATTIRYDLPEASQVKIEIYNMLGQKVRTLVNKQIAAGQHYIHWDGRNDNGLGLSTGLYFVRLKANDFISHKKMLLVK